MARRSAGVESREQIRFERDRAVHVDTADLRAVGSDRFDLLVDVVFVVDRSRDVAERLRPLDGDHIADDATGMGQQSGCPDVRGTRLGVAVDALGNVYGAVVSSGGALIRSSIR